MDNTSKITYNRLCRMPDAAEYAKTIEEFRALADIAETHAEKYASELASLKPENDLRRRTLTIAGRMAKHCASFVGMTWDAKTVGELVAQRMTMLRRMHVTDGLEDALSELSPDDLGVFAFFAHGTCSTSARRRSHHRMRADVPSARLRRTSSSTQYTPSAAIGFYGTAKTARSRLKSGATTCIPPKNT